ncbi:MAG: tRNA (N6-threonylcarbamoyladenosine(37)-N6)-methyltransferase TrmO [Chloroflexi bacterium]|nr:tRNA (N6-threonylcarbamoyladenosine(37)-N6)-methyltransferase TrmO [Chloroflexota bacterium]
MQPIGIIHSPFRKKEYTQIQPCRSHSKGQVEVFPEFVDGLQDLDGFSHIILLYYFHCSKGYSLRVKPFLDHKLHGLFSTRYPCRPNPIGLSVVRLVSITANILEIQGVDILDGTPLLDVKPYIPEFDRVDGVRAGWFEIRNKPEQRC